MWIDKSQIRNCLFWTCVHSVERMYMTQYLQIENYPFPCKNNHLWIIWSKLFHSSNEIQSKWARCGLHRPIRAHKIDQQNTNKTIIIVFDWEIATTKHCGTKIVFDFWRETTTTTLHKAQVSRFTQFRHILIECYRFCCFVILPSRSFYRLFLCLLFLFNCNPN